MKGYLVLADGSIFQGDAFGAAGSSPGEVVFNTGMTGYQEVLTDPSYWGQIVAMTYPLIGNYGINPADFESGRPHVRGFVVRELCSQPSHWQADRSLERYLAEQGVMGLTGVDTRALTRHLRVAGSMGGVIASATAAPAAAGAEVDLAVPGGVVALDGAPRVPVPPGLAAWLGELVAEARAFRLTEAVAHVTTREPYRLAGHGGGLHVVAVDLGTKQNILRILVDLGCDVTVVPADTSAVDILSRRPDGVLLTNGPGDPRDARAAIAAVRELLAAGVPVFGICLGHQVLALALGGDTYKMKFGHRGVNHPVKDLTSGRVYITSQNHGYAVDEKSLPPAAVVTHRNLNDGTVEGLTVRGKPVFSVQYHPEACPGPEESRYLFERFLQMLRTRTPLTA